MKMYAFTDAGKPNPIQSQFKANQTQFKPKQTQFFNFSYLCHSRESGNPSLEATVLIYAIYRTAISQLQNSKFDILNSLFDIQYLPIRRTLTAKRHFLRNTRTPGRIRELQLPEYGLKAVHGRIVPVERTNRLQYHPRYFAGNAARTPKNP